MLGDDVKDLQLILKKLGYMATSTPVTNFFGSSTLKAVIAFQAEYNIIPAKGLVGTVTLHKLLNVTN